MFESPIHTKFVAIFYYFILERYLLLVHKRLTIQTIKDVANGGHISPGVLGILVQKHEKCDPSSNYKLLYWFLQHSHTPAPPTLIHRLQAI